MTNKDNQAHVFAGFDDFMATFQTWQSARGLLKRLVTDDIDAYVGYLQQAQDLNHPLLKKLVEFNANHVSRATGSMANPTYTVGRKGDVWAKTPRSNAKTKQVEAKKEVASLAPPVSNKRKPKAPASDLTLDRTGKADAPDSADVDTPEIKAVHKLDPTVRYEFSKECQMTAQFALNGLIDNGFSDSDLACLAQLITERVYSRQGKTGTNG